MAAALEIRRDLFSSVELRSRARRERNPRTATRMLAIANALEGLTRAEAARLAGMERQALRDAVVRYNQESIQNRGVLMGVGLGSGLTGRGWAGAETGVAGEAGCRAATWGDDRDRSSSYRAR